jgi:hypothetical protein
METNTTLQAIFQVVQSPTGHCLHKIEDTYYVFPAKPKERCIATRSWKGIEPNYVRAALLHNLPDSTILILFSILSILRSKKGLRRAKGQRRLT